MIFIRKILSIPILILYFIAIVFIIVFILPVYALLDFIFYGELHFSMYIWESMPNLYDLWRDIR